MAHTFGFSLPFDPSSLNFFSWSPSVFNASPLPPPQLPVFCDAVSSKLCTRIMELTIRSYYLSPIQVVPKSPKASRLVFECSRLTLTLLSPKFKLPPLPVTLQICPLASRPSLMKVDLGDAFNHLAWQTLHATRLPFAWLVSTTGTPDSHLESGRHRTLCRLSPRP